MRWCVAAPSSKWQNEMKKIKNGSETGKGVEHALEWGFATSTQNSWIERQ